MSENEITSTVIDEAILIHQALGPGLLESVYEVVLCFELNRRGLEAKRQVPVPFKYNPRNGSWTCVLSVLD